ncbi:MAG: MOSC domain-containing protein [Acidobacteriota bacterium]
MDEEREEAVGTVHSINVSDGGVPKRPVDSAALTVNGLVGDTQAELEVHGGPERALSLFSLEVISMLQEEGHPIEPGSTGENITISGMDWSHVVPGTRLHIGDEVQVEISNFAPPCKTIIDSFVDGEFVRISHRLHPDQSRVYARVLKTGMIRQGDAISIGR